MYKIWALTEHYFTITALHWKLSFLIFIRIWSLVSIYPRFITSVVNIYPSFLTSVSIMCTLLIIEDKTKTKPTFREDSYFVKCVKLLLVNYSMIPMEPWWLYIINPLTFIKMIDFWARTDYFLKINESLVNAYVNWSPLKFLSLFFNFYKYLNILFNCTV